jgi:hypothetical protein
MIIQSNESKSGKSGLGSSREYFAARLVIPIPRTDRVSVSHPDKGGREGEGERGEGRKEGRNEESRIRALVIERRERLAVESVARTCETRRVRIRASAYSHARDARLH